MKTRIEKAAEKIKLNVEDAKGMVVCEHEMTYLTPKKQLVTMKVDMNKETRKRLNQIAKTLKVSVDAVATYYLIKYIEKKEAAECSKTNKP